MPKKKAAKQKSTGRKRVNRRKRPIRHMKPTLSKAPRGSSSAQRHQGVVPETIGQSEIAPEISDDADEFGGES